MGPLSPASLPATAPFPSGAHAGLTAALSAPAYSLTTAPTGKRPGGMYLQESGLWDLD